jgi:hypothetical protein
VLGRWLIEGLTAASQENGDDQRSALKPSG